jgi:hypothetical protein
VIQVDNSVKCPKCGNRATLVECCILCDGTGYRNAPVAWGQVSESRVCGDCAGTGKIRTCAKCGADCAAAAIAAQRGDRQ